MKVFASASITKEYETLSVGGYKDWNGHLSTVGMIIDEEDVRSFPCPVECAEGFLVESGSGIISM